MPQPLLLPPGPSVNLSADDLASFTEMVFQVLPGHAPRKVVHVQPVRRDLDHVSYSIILAMRRFSTIISTIVAVAATFARSSRIKIATALKL